MIDSDQAIHRRTNMQVTSSRISRPHSVMAMFDDGLSTFVLSRDATFEELAGRLDHLTERHRGKPIAVNVKLSSRR
jgi:hypothetical protein